MKAIFILTLSLLLLPMMSCKEKSSAPPAGDVHANNKNTLPNYQELTVSAESSASMIDHGQYRSYTVLKTTEKTKSLDGLKCSVSTSPSTVYQRIKNGRCEVSDYSSFATYEDCSLENGMVKMTKTFSKIETDDLGDRYELSFNLQIKFFDDKVFLTNTCKIRRL